MKKTVSIIFLLTILLINSIVCASTLTLEIKSNKEEVEKGEEVVVTVDWKEGMQAADFILNFDDSKFELVSSDLDENFYKIEDSKIRIVWVSLDNSYKTSISFTFRALKSGKAEFSTQIDGGFSNGELDSKTGYLVIPDNYVSGSTNVIVKGLELIYILPIVIIAIIIILVIATKLRKNKRK